MQGVSKENLIEQIMLIFMRKGVEDLQNIKAQLYTVLENYKIEPAETQMVVYTEGKNEFLLKKFLLGKAVAGRTKKTLQCYQGYLERAFNAIGKDADEITSDDLQHLLAVTMLKTSKTNANNVRRVLSSFYIWCQREELITKNPMSRIEPIKEEKKKKFALTEMEVEQIRNACRTNREKAIIEMLFSTWCRASELANIKTADLETDSVTVLGKGEKYRKVFINPRAHIALQNYLSERKDSNPYLFPQRVTGFGDRKNMREQIEIKADWYKESDMVDLSNPISVSSVEQIVRNAGKRAGVDNVHPHRFRRTGATLALRRGMPIEKVSKILGHESIATTQIYLDLNEDELKQAHKKYVV